MLDASAAKANRRKSSRSNSTSSSSIVTIKRAASVSQARAPTPDHNTINNSRTLLGENIPANEGPSSGSHKRLGSFSGVREGVGSLNRWSQSTASSRASNSGPVVNVEGEKVHTRRRSFSRRLSIGGSAALGDTKLATAQSSPPRRNVLTKPRPSPTRAVNTDQRVNTAESTPNLMTQVKPEESRSFAPNSGTSTPGFTTPSARSVESADYFAATWAGNSPASSNTTATVRNITGDSSASKTKVASNPSLHSRAVQSQSSFSSERTVDEDLNPLTTGHSRNREGNKGSAGTDESSVSSVRSDRKKHRPPSQKTMLSKALQKANTAVLLDNAQNFEGAMEAYEDACSLLEQVMIKSTGEEDRKKLQQIRTTYTNRIKELRNLDPAYQVAGGKALPDRPVSDASLSAESRSSMDYDEDDGAVIEIATATKIVNASDELDSYQNQRSVHARSRSNQSLVPSVFADDHNTDRQSVIGPRNFSRSQMRDLERSETPRGLAPPMQSEYMPAPLSPRRGVSPNESHRAPEAPSAENQLNYHPGHSRETSTESTSWLDTIDESGGSSPTSVHSRTSSMGFRRRLLPKQFGYDETEAEFEAALDAAVEAAYDDPYEMADEPEPAPAVDEIILQNRRNVEIAKQRVREAEMEAAYIEETRRRQDELIRNQQEPSQEHDYLDDEEEEEERLLEEMTRGYALDEFEFDLQTKSALPRQSDSSGFSGRTWPSSLGSNTANTSLTSTESVNLGAKQKLPPLRPPPASALPPPPIPAQSDSPARNTPGQGFSRPPSLTIHGVLGVRDRRLSGQNPKQLTIDTHQNAKVPMVSESTLDLSSSNDEPKTATLLPSTQYTMPVPATGPLSSLERSTVNEDGPEINITADNDFVMSSIAEDGVMDRKGRTLNMPSVHKPLAKVTTAPDSMLKNRSFSGIAKSRNLSVSTPEPSDISPITPTSSNPGTEGRKASAGGAPGNSTPFGIGFPTNGLPTGGMNIFDDHTKSPASPNSNQEASTAPPIHLEPCPESFLLRPFWLMRCLYQTLAHPRGGYISTKLFIPRDVWRVKNVKLKGIEEKIACCDLLTAALQKLAKVDTLDADAVLEEMQAFELVLEQVRTVLSKKLGNEVGVQNPTSLFKGATAVDENANSEVLASKNANAPTKSFYSGWRKLRNKSSGVGFSHTGSTAAMKDGAKEGLTLSSLPMTPSITTRPIKRTIPAVQYTGANAVYMEALARLFDAVQILDQIARQVEDPGLKYSSKTHVGLELSTRNAAEFFGFYVCRFALNDAGTLLDKFIKRGSEWVLA